MVEELAAFPELLLCFQRSEGHVKMILLCGLDHFAQQVCGSSSADSHAGGALLS